MIRQLAITIVASLKFVALVPSNACAKGDAKILLEVSASAAAMTELKPVEILNRRRTQMTLVLYSPVLSEMINRGEDDAQGWFC